MKRFYSVAPMMGRTDSQFRYLIRLISEKTVLFTEMIHSKAILYGYKNKLEEYSENENPIVLQLGGNDPESLAKVSKMANLFNYDEINLNLGCPSPRVSNGGFGAAMMNHPNWYVIVSMRLRKILIKKFQSRLDLELTTMT